MTSIELYPTLDHCIEKTAKKEFNRLSAEYLAKGGGNAVMDSHLTLLRAFLEEADFPRSGARANLTCWKAGRCGSC